eukprot:4474373-Prymnesium_polylepis.1
MAPARRECGLRRAGQQHGHFFGLKSRWKVSTLDTCYITLHTYRLLHRRFETANPCADRETDGRQMRHCPTTDHGTLQPARPHRPWRLAHERRVLSSGPRGHARRPRPRRPAVTPAASARGSR